MLLHQYTCGATSQASALFVDDGELQRVRDGGGGNRNRAAAAMWAELSVPSLLDIYRKRSGGTLRKTEKEPGD